MSLQKLPHFSLTFCLAIFFQVVSTFYLYFSIPFSLDHTSQALFPPLTRTLLERLQMTFTWPNLISVINPHHLWSPSKFIRKGNGNPLQYPCLENPMDGGAWWAAVHGVAKSRTQLSDFTFTFHFHALEKEMATHSHSSVLAWRIPGMGEPGGLPSMGSHRVGHDWSDLAVAVEHSLALSFFGIGMKTDLFQSCGHCWVFQICWHIENIIF